VSLIGTLEQLDLPSVLQRIETHTKTGLLVAKQGVQWVEFYFRQGRLMCIGPVRTHATLGERLLHAGLISQQAWQETLAVIGSEPLTEMRIALTLIDLGYVGHEALRTWATQRALEVLHALLHWTQGEVYFEELVSPPADRLLVAMAVTSLLAVPPIAAPLPAPEPEKTNTTIAGGTADVTSTPTMAISSDFGTAATPPAMQQLMDESPSKPAKQNTFSIDVAKVPTLFDTPQFFTGHPAPSTPTQTTDITLSILRSNSADLSGDVPFTPITLQNDTSSVASPADPDQPVQPSEPVLVASAAASRIDTSFMQPDMVLVQADVSALVDRNPSMQITPDQWRLLTRVDGQTSLGKACQDLLMSPEQVCQVAGELMALGLIHVVSPTQAQAREFSPREKEYVIAHTQNASIAPTHQAPTTLPFTDVIQQFSPPLAFETYSQWGNGGNGATFVPGRGWVAPSQSPRLSGPLAIQNGMYTPVLGRS
jgi:hypothetical protein